MKLKFVAAALAIGFAAQAGAATIDNGATGNGGLFLNIWDGSSSYTLNLGNSITSFKTLASTTISRANASTGLVASYAADSTLTNWLAANPSSGDNWAILSTGTSGAARNVVLSYTAPGGVNTLGVPSNALQTDQVTRSASGSIQTFLGNVNPSLASANSATFLSTDAGYAGNLGTNIIGLETFSTAAMGAGSLDMMNLAFKGTGATAAYRVHPAVHGHHAADRQPRRHRQL